MTDYDSNNSANPSSAAAGGTTIRPARESSRSVPHELLASFMAKIRLCGPYPRNIWNHRTLIPALLRPGNQFQFWRRRRVKRNVESPDTATSTYMSFCTVTGNGEFPFPARNKLEENVSSQDCESWLRNLPQILGESFARLDEGSEAENYIEMGRMIGPFPSHKPESNTYNNQNKRRYPWWEWGSKNIEGMGWEAEVAYLIEPSLWVEPIRKEFHIRE